MAAEEEVPLFWEHFKMEMTKVARLFHPADEAVVNKVVMEWATRVHAVDHPPPP